MPKLNGIMGVGDYPHQFYTKDGVCKDLRHSVYILSIGSFKFYFSSEYNKQRFMKQYAIEYVKTKKYFEESLRMNLSDVYDYSNIRLYNKIEKRGFWVRDLKNKIWLTADGGEICLNGMKILLKNYKPPETNMQEN